MLGNFLLFVQQLWNNVIRVVGRPRLPPQKIQQTVLATQRIQQTVLAPATIKRTVLPVQRIPARP